MNLDQTRHLKLSTFHLFVLFHFLITLYLTFFERPLPIIIGLLTILASILVVRFYGKNRTVVNRYPILAAYVTILIILSISGGVASLKNRQWEGFGLISTVYSSDDETVPVYRYKIRPSAENEYPQFPNLPRSNRFANLPDEVPFYVINEGFLWVDKEGAYAFRVDRVRAPHVFIDGERIQDDQGVFLSRKLHNIRIQYWKDSRTTNFLPKWYRIDYDTDEPAETPPTFSDIPLTHFFSSEEAFTMKTWLYVKYYTPYVLLVLWLPLVIVLGIKFIKDSAFRKAYLHYALLAGIILCGVWLRWFLLTTTFQFPDADEATIGTMGIKILNGESFLMYYGVPYIGSFDSLLASLWFVFLGVNNLALKCYPFLVSLILIWLIYRLGREIYTVRTGLFAALFASIGTPFMTEWGLKLRGGHLVVLMFGTILMLLVYRTVFKKQTIPQAYPIMGFLSGLSLWIYAGSIVYIATIVLFLVLHDKKFFVRRQFLWFSIYFALGVLPLLIWNVQNGFETLHFFRMKSLPFVHNILRSTINLHNMGDNLLDLIGLPPSVGFAQIVLFTYATISIYACLVLHLLITRDKGIHSLCKLSLQESDGTEMFLVLASLTIFLYVYSQFGYYGETARYFIPFLTILPILLARFVLWLKDRNFTISLLIVLFLLYISLMGNLRIAHSQLGPLQKDLTHVVHFLEEKELTYLVGPYWLVGRIVFESEEQILALPFSYASAPHLPYQDVFKRLDPKEIAYIAETGDPINITDIDHYTRMVVGDFTIYVHETSKAHM